MKAKGFNKYHWIWIILLGLNTAGQIVFVFLQICNDSRNDMIVAFYSKHKSLILASCSVSKLLYLLW